MQHASIEERILRFLSSAETATAETLRRHAGVPPHNRKTFLALLARLCAAGRIEYKNGVYSLPRPVLYTGVLTGNEKGFAFFTPDSADKNNAAETPEKPRDIFIPAKYLNGAMHKDRVVVKIVKRGENESATGEVEKILERGYTEIVGAFYKDRRAGRLLPDERKYFSEIYIPLASCRNVKSGVKAVAKITAYRCGACPEGTITEVLGDDDDFFAEETSILRSFGLREEFPDSVLAAAEEVAAEDITTLPLRTELLPRRNLLNEFFVTIDGADTRDIDDGVSVVKQGDNYVLSVHIADVSHYVKAGGELDKEAFKRGTSVYFPDRVLPMLPQALSNGCCSLNEGEARLAFTCKMLIAGGGTDKSDAENAGKVLESEIFPSLVRSAYRLTYDEVDAMLSGGAAAEKLLEKYPLMRDSLAPMRELTEILAARRVKKGEVNLDLKEKHIYYDKERDVIEIPDEKPSFSRGLIEQFMVTANETVATFLNSRGAPCLYRVHEPPVPEKAENLKAFARLLGFSPKWNDEEVFPADYAALLNEARGGAKEQVLAKVTLRSMQKARYCEKNLKHFALVSGCYCHFTSPIRRYPDLFVHRALKAVLSANETATERLKEFAAEAAKKTSDTERNADDAERAVDDLYAAAYMADYIGQEFDGVISGVTERGFFAELKNGIEGFVPLDSLYGYYIFLPDTFELKGGGKSYALGNNVRVKVTDVDFYTRRITFSAVKSEKTEEKI